MGVVDLVLASLAAFEDEADQADLLSNLCLAGHTTRLPGFVERLTAELRRRLSPVLAARLRVQPLERPAEGEKGRGGSGAHAEGQVISHEEEQHGVDADVLPYPSAGFSATPAPAFDSAAAQAAACAADRALASAGAWWDSADWSDGRDVGELVADVNFGDGL